MSQARALTEQLIPAAVRWMARGRGAIEVSLLAVLLIVLASLIWAVLAPSAPRNIEVRPLPGLANQPQQEVALAADRTQLVRVNPFAVGASGPVEDVAPETSLNIVLESLFMSTSGPMGSVSLRIPDGDVKTFRPGDEILNGIYLERILSDRVVLNRAGNREVLRKFGRGDGFRALNEYQTATEASTVERLGAPEVSRGQAQSMRTLLLNLEITPVTDGNTLTGLSVMPKGNMELIAAAGLAPGDVVFAVNGEQITTSDSTELIARLQDRRSVSLTIRRNNIEREVQIDFAE